MSAYQPIAAVRPERGMVAASSKDTLCGTWKVVQSGHGIFCKTTVFYSERMKSCYTVAWFEFIDVLADGMDNAGNF